MTFRKSLRPRIHEMACTIGGNRGWSRDRGEVGTAADTTGEIDGYDRSGQR